MQISVPDELIRAGKLILMLFGVCFLIAVCAWGIVHIANLAPVQSAPVVTPTPTPGAFVPYWTGVLEITGMQTGSGPQIDCANGQSFYVSWQDYYRLRLHEIASFHIVSTSQPWNTVMFNADQVVVTGYAWEYHNYDEYRARVVYGSAGRFCIDSNSKYLC
jgi:hypothetical protein